FFAGQLEQQVGGGSRYAAEAAQAAEEGTAAVLSDWDTYSLNNTAIGATVAPLGTVNVNNKLRYTTSIRRLNTELFLIRTLGERTGNGAVLSQRTVGNLVRLLYANANARAAVTVTKPITFNGNAFSINGNDSIPKGWDKDSLGNADPSCSLSANQAGIRSATTTGANNGDLTKIDGNPEVVANDATVNNDFFNVFGDVTFDELKKSADVVISATTPQQPAPTLLAAAPFRCNISDDNNWGEPRRTAGYIKACSTYFPVIYASGSQLKMSGGSRGQGLLLIEGDLEIVGGFEFSGLIVAKGGIKIAGTGNKITGALLAQNVAIDDKNVVSGNTSLQYSSCAINKAVQGSANASPLGTRSWVQLYQ
ncbi:MAG TPA: hypothetical protein VEB59_01245, partial [Gemmatimonadales bacterium]|nr:hypothetical protein [Gemmatimonadales bacterium]